jgi:hypothetical protein
MIRQHFQQNRCRLMAARIAIEQMTATINDVRRLDIASPDLFLRINRADRSWIQALLNYSVSKYSNASTQENAPETGWFSE